MRKSLLALLLLAGAGPVQAQVQLEGDYPQHDTMVQGNTIKLLPRIRSTPITETLDRIALETINSFLLANRIIDEPEQFQAAPYIVAGDNERVLSGMGDRIFARGEFEPGATGYGIFRQGKSYIDPDSQEFLGINADDIGSVGLIAEQGDVATLELLRSTQEVRLGDRLFSSEERAINPTFMLSAPPGEIDGVIIDVPRGVTQVAKYDVVTLNKGKRDGLSEGNVLAVYKAGETIRDRVTGEPLKIPDERAGRLMVFRTYEKLSYGLVLNASHSLAVMDKVRNR
ncbi:peptidoglycan-binding protein [Pseudomonas sp. LS1212]|uniref:peptidoglycan-binding protein n=1 Tax=Pseudomonas sp. LS1212 TaxID=2972478 RepID=UPI00215C876A|nr:peptidoglycan-binding protein [Pseudomonas sp. LS1212]UVJ44066.1 peptidoglycan-binding protein [Pseudomonas sp. LS1212]